MSRIEILQREFLARFAMERANAEYPLTGKRNEKAVAKFKDTLAALAIEWEFADE